MIYPAVVITFALGGEETGALDTMLTKIADFFARGRRSGQGADLDPRAGHDHPGRRNRGVIVISM
jgi:hypothetical protein